MTFIHVAKTSDVAVGSKKLVKVGDTKVLLFHLSDGFHATEPRCSHMKISLEKGPILDDCQVQCPLHRARFDIRTGEVSQWACFPPGIQLLNVIRSEKALQTYPVKIDGDKVLVQV